MSQQNNNQPASNGSHQGIEFSGLIRSMLNAISQPVSVKPGGYSEDIFLDLPQEEKEKFECSICYLVVKDPKECPNHHIFCSSCILTWSVSFVTESHSKCPVCRTTGRYRPSPDIDKILSRKHVKCPETNCSWAGKLLDYKWHSRRHENNERRTLPPAMMRTQSVNGMAVDSNLENNLDSFSDRLDRRRRNIQLHLRQQELTRRESLEEVEMLSRRLGHVAHDIEQLLGNMQHDSRRFNQYVHEAQDSLPVIMASPISSPRTPPPQTSPRSEARLERIMSASSSTPRNPFIVPDNLPILRPAPRTPLVSLPHGYSPRETDARVQQLMLEPTPTENPFTLPDDLPILRPPPRTRNSLIVCEQSQGTSNGQRVVQSGRRASIDRTNVRPSSRRSPSGTPRDDY